MKHFVNRLYEEQTQKFPNSPNLTIAYSFYQFKTMKNVHASLIELSAAEKRKPSLQQQFTLFRYKKIIEDSLREDEYARRYLYPELCHVIEFERLFSEMEKCIE